jgi:arginase family enzyme
MKDLSIYFQPVSNDYLSTQGLGSHLLIHTDGSFPQLKSKGIALMYVPEYRNGGGNHHSAANDSFRKHFYALNASESWRLPVYDLGTLLPGAEIEDTYYAVRQVIAELVKNSIIPVLVGGSQDLTFAMYQGFEELEQMINAMNVDYKLDIGDPEEPISADGFVNRMLMHRPCFLFNYSTLGVQAPFVRKDDLTLFEKLYFDMVRLGEYAADFRVAEPHLRNTDLLSIDLQVLRSADFPNDQFVQPNGLFNHELCQIARYAGISDKLSALGLFNLSANAGNDLAHSSLAQIIWYFIDGVAQRVGDFPVGLKKNYTRFTVFLDELDHELVFYKSDKSARWWMEVPYPPLEGVKFERHHMVPCNKGDYDNALKGDIPNLWWKTYQKLG